MRIGIGLAMGQCKGPSLVQKAIGILRKYGADAHVYLPGIGTVSGLTAGNYLDSAGTTAATVDNPVGLSLDALQAMTLGSELVTNGSNLVTTTGWTATALSGAPASLSVSGGSLMVTNTGGTYGVAAQTVPVTSGLTYQISALLTKGTAAAVNIRVGSTALGYEYTDQAVTGIAVPITATFKATSSNVFISLLNTNTTNGTGIYGEISVREIPGVHATQATTANKPILRQSGGKYSWQFDGGNDSLSLSAPLFQMSDDHCVIAGVNVSVTALQNIFSASGGVAVAHLKAGSAYWRDDASNTINISPTGTYPLNTAFVATMRKIGTEFLVRRDGAYATTAYTSMGSATLGPATIGGAAGQYLNGSIYPLIGIKGSVTDSDLLTLERFVGRLSGVSL